ncbi:hypothetical protein JOC75_001873 [Metabacillus crassostreae]|uniref:heparinase II/III family protein n=1 Tax=Metabacillus crassostreae TaxID=929098 RepID=UPI001957FCE5|nr:heparinase II/III family protein [Metabacillus crassostreae]MBM7603900.1 hypothetical protein [Metabacillus crassostreae]
MLLKYEQIHDLIKKNKFSLLFSSKQEQDNWFKEIKEKIVYQSLLLEIKDDATKLLETPLQELTFYEFTIFRETGSRLAYERSYFAKRRRLNTFALMTLIEPDEPIYLKELHEAIWSICNEYTWCLPAHLKNSPEMDTKLNEQFQHLEDPFYTIDLFAAETAFTLSEILKLTEHIIDPLIQKRVVNEVFRRVLVPFQKQSFDWETSTHNWSAVCAGAIGSAALHLIKDDKQLASILEKVLKAISYYLKGFNNDGACMEGYGYWQYGFGFFVYFADLLKKKTSGEMNLFHIQKVHQIALFQQKCFIYKNQVVNFSDSTERGAIFLGLSHYLKTIFPDMEAPEVELRSSYCEDHCSRWAPAFRNLLWLDDKISGNPWRNETYYLKDSQWFISRHDGYVFACKGGHNDEPHNHNDIGHFILQAKGESFLMDLGSGMYCEDYFNKKRYTFLCNGSQGHSVPVINNQFQAEGYAHKATIIDYSSQAEDLIEMDLKKAYNMKSLQHLVRKFQWQKSHTPELVLFDTFHFTENPTSIVERFITPVMKVIEDSTGVILEGAEKIKVHFDREQLELIIRKNEFINHFGKREELYQLDFSVKKPSKLTSVEFRFRFM